VGHDAPGRVGQTISAAVLYCDGTEGVCTFELRTICDLVISVGMPPPDADWPARTLLIGSSDRPHRQQAWTPADNSGMELVAAAHASAKREQRPINATVSEPVTSSAEKEEPQHQAELVVAAHTSTGTVRRSSSTASNTSNICICGCRIEPIYSAAGKWSRWGADMWGRGEGCGIVTYDQATECPHQYKRSRCIKNLSQYLCWKTGSCSKPAHNVPGRTQ
jgi:hypothetical protein